MRRGPSSVLGVLAAALAMGGRGGASAIPVAPAPREEPQPGTGSRRRGRILGGEAVETETRPGHGSRSYGRSYADRIGDAGSRQEVEALLHEVTGLRGAGAKTLRRCRKAAARRIDHLEFLEEERNGA